jgi:hypothetical protein
MKLFHSTASLCPIRIKKSKGIAPVPKSAVIGSKATASSEEKIKNNFAKNTVDDNPGPRWCVSGDGKGGEPLVSLMPFGLAAGLTPEQLADRLAYLRSL